MSANVHTTSGASCCIKDLIYKPTVKNHWSRKLPLPSSLKMSASNILRKLQLNWAPFPYILPVQIRRTMFMCMNLIEITRIINYFFQSVEPLVYHAKVWPVLIQHMTQMGVRPLITCLPVMLMVIWREIATGQMTLSGSVSATCYFEPLKKETNFIYLKFLLLKI